MFKKVRAKDSFLDFSKKSAPYFVIAILAILTYLLIYGYHIINPTYTDWLLGKGDLSQHYIGWQAFKNGQWLFPIGLSDQLSYPSATSIIFTDSIPLFAVFFKIFRAILPTEFQYFGIWGVLCFVLQGMIAAHIIQRFVKSKLYVVLTSMLFVIAPVMIFRMYVHTALAGHWIILLALDSFFASKTARNRATYLRWAAIGALSASTHLYLLFMCGIVLVGCCLEEVIRTRHWKKPIFIVLSFLLSSLIVVALLGGFSSSMEAANSGLGVFSWNLNAFFNPRGWSKLLRDLPAYEDWQSEGFAYLGAGVIFLLSLSFIAIVDSKKIRTSIRARKSQVIAICVVFFIALVVSLSPVITLNKKVLLEIPLPQIIKDLWSIFRATGRISWVMIYLIMFGSVITAYHFINRRSAVIIAVVVLGLQVYDIHDQLKMRHEDFAPKIVYQSQLTDTSFWNNVTRQGNIRHVVLVPRFSQLSAEAGWSLANWALDNRLTLNDFYFARENAAVFNANRNTLLAAPDASEIFIMNTSDRFEAAAIDLYYYQVNGLIVGTVEPIPGEVCADENDLSVNRYTFGDNRVINGEEKDGSRYLYDHGLSYGPYWLLPKGTYQVVVNGSNLTNCSVSAYSSAGQTQHAISEIVTSDNQIAFTVAVEENSFSFEVIVQNQSDEEVRLSSIDISRKR